MNNEPSANEVLEAFETHEQRTRTIDDELSAFSMALGMVREYETRAEKISAQYADVQEHLGAARGRLEEIRASILRRISAGRDTL